MKINLYKPSAQKRLVKAIEKFEKNLTEHERDLLVDHIIRTVFMNAEDQIQDKHKARVMPHYSLSVESDTVEGTVRQVVYWYHHHLRHFWGIGEDGKATYYKYE